jgi:hypothetical protein
MFTRKFPDHCWNPISQKLEKALELKQTLWALPEISKPSWNFEDSFELSKQSKMDKYGLKYPLLIPSKPPITFSTSPNEHSKLQKDVKQPKTISQNLVRNSSRKAIYIQTMKMCLTNRSLSLFSDPHRTSKCPFYYLLILRFMPSSAPFTWRERSFPVFFRFSDEWLSPFDW